MWFQIKRGTQAGQEADERVLAAAEQWINQDKETWLAEEKPKWLAQEKQKWLAEEKEVLQGAYELITMRRVNDEALNTLGPSTSQNQNPVVVDSTGPGSLPPTGLDAVHSNLECTQCKLKFKYVKAYSRHMKARHSKRPKHRCNICTRTYTQKGALRKHMSKHTISKVKNLDGGANPCSSGGECGAGVQDDNEEDEECSDQSHSLVATL